MARQLCCRGMCKNLLQSDDPEQNYSEAKFPSNLNCGKKIVSETGPWTTGENIANRWLYLWQWNDHFMDPHDEFPQLHLSKFLYVPPGENICKPHGQFNWGESFGTFVFYPWPLTRIAPMSLENVAQNSLWYITLLASAKHIHDHGDDL